jgi:anti-sigma regulatory factor (Ser/Thr protein kinase)
MSGKFRACFSSSHGSAVEARRALLAYIDTFGFSRQHVADIECAVGEALANAAEHGHREGSSFEVHAFVEGEELVIEVHDDGPGFSYPENADAEAPPSGSPRGFGIFIMRSLVDEIAYSDRGRRIRLKKRLRADGTAAGDDELSANG